MSSTPPAPPRKKGGCGCLLTGLVIFVALVAAIIGSTYYMVFHTALPLQWAGRAILGLDFKIIGASGSSASGYTVQSVRWRNSRGELCEIDDVRFKSAGGFGFMSEGKLIISELSVGKARIYLAPLNGVTVSGNPNSFSYHSSSSTSSSSSSFSYSSSNSSGNLPKPLHIDRVHLNDIYIADSGAGFEFAMPSLDFSGFKMDPGKTDLGNLQIDSDRLDVRTDPGRALDLQGKSVSFQKLLTGTLKPPLSKSIKQPIDFTLDLGLTEQNQFYYHLVAFKQALEVFVDQDQTQYYHAKDLPLSSYLSFTSYDAPSKITLDGSVPTNVESDGNELTPPTGDVAIGVTDFTVDAGKISVAQKDGRYRYEIKATNRAGNADLIAALKLQSEDPRVQLAFSSKPPLPPREIISKIFFGRNFAELDPAEQTQVEQKTGIYFPPSPAAPSGS